MLHEIRTVHVDSAILRTKRIGDPAGRPLLLLHGGLGTLEDFDAILPGLTDFQCVLIDSRGHGGSTLGTPLDYERLALDAEAVINFFGLSEPIVIGHSDGGIAAIRMAASKRKKLGGLILLGAHTDPPPQRLLDGVFARLTARSWKTKYPEGHAAYERLNPEPDFDRLFDAALRMWRDTSPENYPGSLAELVSCPTLVLGGDRDHLVPREITIDLARRIPGAHLGILPFGSHILFQEYPERTLSCLHQFLGMR